ncbi:MAG: dethiobiotin synthase [Sphingomonadales bacterium]|nr:dethiobiotin synthase [Sphingomonadales bacterium]
MRLFITATGTGVGKTYVTAALLRVARLRGLRSRAVKPLLSGFDPSEGENDAALLLAAQGLPPAMIDTVSPWRYVAPLSPDMAAARQGETVPVDAVIAFTQTALRGQEDVVLIEGVGGAFVPLDERRTVADWIAACPMAWPVVVAGSYLGTLSHTIATVRAMEARGIPPVAVVLSESLGDPPPLAETMASLSRHLPGLAIWPLPRGGDGDALFDALRAAATSA